MAEKAVLLYGDPLGDDYPFADQAAERAAWDQHRAELLADHPPGCRPFAFWKFDVGVTLGLRDDELRELLDRGLVELTEAVLVERARPELATDAVPSIFRTEADFRAAHYLDIEALNMWRARLSLAEAWHAWRNRPELAELYSRRLAWVVEVLADREVRCGAR